MFEVEIPTLEKGEYITTLSYLSSRGGTIAVVIHDPNADNPNQEFYAGIYSRTKEEWIERSGGMLWQEAERKRIEMVENHF